MTASPPMHGCEAQIRAVQNLRIAHSLASQVLLSIPAAFITSRALYMHLTSPHSNLDPVFAPESELGITPWLCVLFLKGRSESIGSGCKSPLPAALYATAKCISSGKQPTLCLAVLTSDWQWCNWARPRPSWQSLCAGQQVGHQHAICDCQCCPLSN